jgi:hypothetical protein
MNIYFPIQNKYYHWYQSLVAKAKNRILPDTIYQEKHHILPKCLGGDDSPNNLVSFTLREHYLAHLILSKMYEGEAKKKMLFALWIMLLQEKKRGSRIFEMYRKKYIENALKQQIVTDEFRKKVSEGKKGKSPTKTTKLLERYEKQKITMVGCGNPMFGKKHSEETKNKISQANKGRKKSKETIQKIISKTKGRKLKRGCNLGEKNPMFGKKHSSETLKKISQKSLGRTLGTKWINNGFQNKRIKPDDIVPFGWFFGRLNKVGMQKHK